ncbi:hypothetical protein BDR07DRAFT_1485506 [Suillus spraguei]|nr:hypothetical protein BDR07DRAFT_1485506 [Suillus spraguei]
MSSVGQNFKLWDHSHPLQLSTASTLPTTAFTAFYGAVSCFIGQWFPCTQALFPPLQHGYAALPPSLPSSHSVDLEAHMHHNYHNQFHARLECRKLNDPYSKTGCQEHTHAFEQRMHDLSKDTVRLRKTLERRKEEHEHRMSKKHKKLQKMADREKQKELIRVWKEWWRHQKAWSSCQEQVDAYDKLLYQAPIPGWKLPQGWKHPPPPSGKLF